MSGDLFRTRGGWPVRLPVAALVLAIATATALAARPDVTVAGSSAEAAGLRPQFDEGRAETAGMHVEPVQLAQAAPTPSTDPDRNSASALLALRVNQLEQDLRSATGRIEELSYKVRRLEERLDKLIADVDYRLSERGGAAGAAVAEPRAGEPPVPPPPSAGGPRILGQGAPSTSSALGSSPAAGGSTAPPAQSAAVASPAPPAVPTGTARDDYTRAFGLLQKGNYAEAETAFGIFLQQHKDDALADNARYWLGETFYARGDYQRAAEAFLDAYEKGKSGPKAPDTLLKLGMSLEGLGKTKEACASFRELGRAFPDAATALQDRAKQEQQKLKCP